MYERMLDKSARPTLEQMTAYCGEAGPWYQRLCSFLEGQAEIEGEIRFPYGNHYGWGVSYRRGKKLICTLFCEDGAFTMMLRLSNAQYAAVYDKLSAGAQQVVDARYPCSDGGWIHLRVLGQTQFEDAKKLLSLKLLG